MKKILHILVVLSGVGVLSGLCLVYMYKYAAPLIAENQVRETREAIFKVIFMADSYDKVKDMQEVFLAKDKSGKPLGYVFTAEGNGYQGKIKLIAGVNMDYSTITGIEILESQETPGLGQEITNPKFKTQFEELRTAPGIVCVKGRAPEKGNEIQALTGATISSKAVAEILNRRIAKLQQEG